MIAPLPSAMPRKANVIHQQILAALIAQPSRSNRLAQNVSEENVDRIARRWIR